MVAAALLDGNVLPAQYRPERLTGVDIQGLLRRIVVKSSEEYTARFPAEMCATVTVILNDGRSYRIDKSDYEGFVTRRMGWELVIAKFNDVTSAFTSELARIRIIDAVQNLDKMRVRDFTAILADLT